MKLLLALPALALVDVACAAGPVHIELRQSASPPDQGRRAIARSGLRAKRAGPGPVNIDLQTWKETTDLQWYGTVSIGSPPQEL
jgi:hypothetical protein